MPSTPTYQEMPHSLIHRCWDTNCMPSSDVLKAISR